jgi:hypothetical protein
MNQMAHEIERAPGIFISVSERPSFRQVTQKRSGWAAIGWGLAWKRTLIDRERAGKARMRLA